MAQVTTAQYLENIQAGLLQLLTTKKEALPPGFNEKRFALNCITVINDMLKDGKKREKLNKVNPNTIPLCFIKGAYLGLDFLNRECYAIPYGNTMNFQTDYKGEIKVCKTYSKDPIKDIYAKVVREGDEYEEGVENGVQVLNFKPIPFSDAPIIGAFAVAYYKDGTIKYESMSKSDIEHTRSTYSKQQDSQAWTESTGEMYKKTVIRRLSKLIDKNLDHIEQIAAYEDGSGFEFETTRGGRVYLPSTEDSDEVVDALGGSTVQTPALEDNGEKPPIPAFTGKNQGREKEPVSAEKQPQKSQNQQQPQQNYSYRDLDFPDDEPDFAQLYDSDFGIPDEDQGLPFR